MKTYKGIIKETLIREVEVEAESEDDALYQIPELYDNCDIVLDAEDFDAVDISVEEVKNEQD